MQYGAQSCGCAYDLDCTADFIFGDGSYVANVDAGYNTIASCRDVCDSWDICGAFVFDPTGGELGLFFCELIMKDVVDSDTVKIDTGNKVFGRKTSAACSRDVTCDIGNNEHYDR